MEHKHQRYNPALENSELKPCPFCGENRYYGETVKSGIGLEFYNTDFTGRDESYVKCFTCDASGGTDITDSLALKKWNARTQEIESLEIESLQTQLKEAEAQNKKLVDVLEKTRNSWNIAENLVRGNDWSKYLKRLKHSNLEEFEEIEINELLKEGE